MKAYLSTALDIAYHTAFTQLCEAEGIRPAARLRKMVIELVDANPPALRLAQIASLSFPATPAEPPAPAPPPPLVITFALKEGNEYIVRCRTEGTTWQDKTAALVREWMMLWAGDPAAPTYALTRPAPTAAHQIASHTPSLAPEELTAFRDACASYKADPAAQAIGLIREWMKPDSSPSLK